jgi:shikimate dehydrogenase
MTDHYAVVGNPVAHSRSPQIHAEFARQTGQDLDYARLLAPLDGFKAAILKFRDDGGKGVNVTLPFKHEAWDLVNVHRGCALDAEAVNTITFQDGKIIGDNTDGIGLLTDLERNLAFPVRGKRVLLMGAGGATYGVMHPILNARPERLVVANRTLDKAVSLVAHFNRFEKFAIGGVSAQPYQKLAGSQFDLVINATSAGLNDEMPALPAGVFAPGALAYDMVYGKATPFMKFAAGQGATIADGLGMLVEQAAESFLIWRGVRPQTAPVIALLRAQDGAVSSEQRIK